MLEILVPGVIGASAGAIAVLYLVKKPSELPQHSGKGWDTLVELSKERAEITAKKKALKKAFSEQKIDEKTFIIKDAYFTKHLEELDKDLDKVLEREANKILPEEMKESGEKLHALSDLTELSKKIQELEKQKDSLESEKDLLHLQMSELEDNHEDSEVAKEKWDNTVVQINEIKKELNGLEDLSTSNLKQENKILRQSLNRNKELLKEVNGTLNVLRTVFERHAEEINHAEEKSPEQVKKLVKPTEEVIEKAKELVFPKKVFEFVRDQVSEVAPHVSAELWLSPKEVLRLKAGDNDDRAILLCSLLRALNKDAKVVMVQLENNLKRAVVIHDNQVLDPINGRDFDSFIGLSEEEALKKYLFDSQKIKKVLYEYNDEKYTNI